MIPSKNLDIIQNKYRGSLQLLAKWLKQMSHKICSLNLTIKDVTWYRRYLLHLEKKALKTHHRLYLYHQILMPVPENFNISQKNDFKQQIKTLFKRNTEDIILEGRWIMK